MFACKVLRRAAAGGAAAVFLLVSGVFQPVSADVGQDRWWNWGNGGGASTTQPYNRSRARQWEAQPPAGLPTLSRDNIPVMKAAIKRYAAIVDNGGWKAIPEVELRAGIRHGAVPLLRRRLELTGDLPEGYGYSPRFDHRLESAVERFQKRHGLTPTGVVGDSTLMALNVSANARLRQLRKNLARVNSLSRSADNRYVLVNIPAAQVELVENDRVVSRHSAVVGKTDRRTPVLRSNINRISFNPYWNIPQSIVRKDLVPKARQYARAGKDALEAYRIEAFDGSGRKVDPEKINWNSSAVYGYAYRQVPWEDNSMGFVKIGFPNRHAVYLHDTPSKSLFGRNYRAHSSGCIRVHNVEQLVTWLLAGNGNWDSARIREMALTGAREDVRLKNRTDVYLAYVTAWGTRDGTVHFRRDLYGRDGVGKSATAY